MRPPIFSPWRKRVAPRPKDTAGGGFRFPPPAPPLETTQRGGQRPSPLDSPPGGANPRRSPHEGVAERNARKEKQRQVLSCTRTDALIPSASGFRRAPQSAFFLYRARHVLFGQDQKECGAHRSFRCEAAKSSLRRHAASSPCRRGLQSQK